MCMGKQVEETVDLVVLSVGLETPDSMVRLAEKIGIHMTPDRFASISAFMPVHTSKKGIFTCGAFNGPRDIPQSVIGGSAAAASVSALLTSARHTRTRIPAAAGGAGCPHRNRASAFLSVTAAPTSPAWSMWRRWPPMPPPCRRWCMWSRNLFTCAQDTQDLMVQQIREKRLNRIVVAACTPRTHEPLFRKTLKPPGSTNI
jgi:heterodisulfide reductase subunit A2